MGGEWERDREKERQGWGTKCVYVHVRELHVQADIRTRAWVRVTQTPIRFKRQTLQAVWSPELQIRRRTLNSKWRIYYRSGVYTYTFVCARCQPRRVISDELCPLRLGSCRRVIAIRCAVRRVLKRHDLKSATVSGVSARPRANVLFRSLADYIYINWNKTARVFVFYIRIISLFFGKICIACKFADTARISVHAVFNLQ